MATFHLQIVTPEGLKFDDQVDNIILRTVNGDVGILKGHISYVTAIDAGKVKIKIDGKDRFAAASEGFISVGKEITRLVATTFEWADEIDVERAEKSLKLAESRLSGDNKDKDFIEVAKMRKKRATVRLNVAEKA